MGVVAMMKEGRMWPMWYMTEESYNKRHGLRLWAYSSRCSKVYMDVLLAMWSSLWMYSSQCGQVRGCTPHYMAKFVDVLLANVFKERPYRPKGLNLSICAYAICFVMV